MLRKLILAVVTVTLYGWLLPPAAAQPSPSFDRDASSTPIERILCNDGEIGDLDGTMGAMYYRLAGQLKGAERSALLADQVYWLERRNQKCSIPSSGDITVEAALHGRTCLVGVYKERIARLSGPFPISSDWLMDRPATLSEENIYSTFVSSMPSAAEAREELKLLRARFPYQRFSLFRPYGDHKFWAILTASYTSYEHAHDAELSAKRLGIAADAFVDRLPDPLDAALEWSPEPSRQTILECLSGGAETIQEMYSCSGALLTPAVLDTCVRDGQCNLQVNALVMDQYLVSKGLTWTSSLSIEPGIPDLNALSACKSNSGSDQARFDDCSVKTFNDPSALFGCAEAEANKEAIARCLLSHIPGLDTSQLNCLIGDHRNDPLACLDKSASAEWAAAKQCISLKISPLEAARSCLGITLDTVAGRFGVCLAESRGKAAASPRLCFCVTGAIKSN